MFIGHQDIIANKFVLILTFFRRKTYTLLAAFPFPSLLLYAVRVRLYHPKNQRYCRFNVKTNVAHIKLQEGLQQSNVGKLFRVYPKKNNIMG